MINDLLAKFPDAKHQGEGWAAKCPAHDDHRASLSIGTGADGRVLLHCHAGCTLDAILAAVNLVKRDLFPEPKPTMKKTIIATYDYHDEVGNVSFQVLRYRPKGFRVRRPDGAGGWLWNMKGVRRVLFGLPELRDQKAVYLVEGEKDVLAVRAVGLSATTNAGGAGKWSHEHVTQLQAVGITKVIVIPDNDAAGRTHAQIVADSCHHAGIEVQVVNLPGLPPKGDFSDWMKAGHTVNELLELSDRTAPWNPAGSAPRTSGARKEAIAVRLADVKPTTIDWLWPKRFARRKIGLLVGDGGLGKSSIMLDLAARHSRGLQMPDGAPGVQGATIFLSAEDDPADTIRPRLDRLGADVRHIYCLQAVRESNGSEHMFSLGRDLDALEALIVKTKALLVVIDPLNAYLGSQTDSYKDSEVRALLAAVSDLAARQGPAIVGIMHLRKGDAQAQHRILGSVAFGNAARLVLGVGYADPKKRDSADPRYLVPLKQNICAPAPTLSFTLPDGRLTWGADPVPCVSADDVLSPRLDRRDEDASDAETLIQTLLDTENWPLPARTAEDAARAHGIHERTLRRAARRVGIVPRPIGGGKSRRWIWHRPEPDSRDVSSMSGNVLYQKSAEKALTDIGDIADTSEAREVDHIPASEPDPGADKASREDAWVDL